MIHRFAIGQTDFGITTTASGGAGSVNISAGSTSIVSTAFTFSNSNGVTFGIDTNAQITASVQTNYQTPGAYLTTAMASNRGSDFVQAAAAFHGTNASGTINSNNISVSVAAPAAQSINISAGTTSSNVTAVTFSNANGVSFGYDGTNVTATVATNYQSQGAYLTTAALSQDSSKYAGTGFTTATTAGTNVVGTLNTGGLSMGVPAYLTTAMQSNAATISNIKISAGASSSNVSAVTFSNANGVSFGYDGTNVTATVATNYQSQGAYLTTAALSSQTLAFSLGGNSATTNSSQISNGGYVLAGGNSLTIQQSNNSISFSVGNYITTADLSQNSSKYAGTGFTTATTAGTAIVGTLNTSGLSMGVPAYLTAAAGAAWTASDSATSLTIARLAFTNSNNVTLTLSTTTGGSATLVASVATSLTNINVSAGATSNNLSAITFSNSNGVTFGLSASTMTASVAKQATGSFYENLPAYLGTSFTTDPFNGVSQLYIIPFQLPYPISVDYIRMLRSANIISTTAGGTTANTSFTHNKTVSVAVVIYSQATGANSESITSIGSTVVSSVQQTAITAGTAGSQYTVSLKLTYATGSVNNNNFATNYAVSSGTYNISTGSMSLFTGMQFNDIPFATSLDQGNYWLGFGLSTNSASNAGPNSFAQGQNGLLQSNVAVTNVAVTWIVPGVASNTTNQFRPGFGSFSTNSAISSTGAIAYSQISGVSSYPQIVFQMIRKA